TGRPDRQGGAVAHADGGSPGSGGVVAGRTGPQQSGRLQLRLRTSAQRYPADPGRCQPGTAAVEIRPTHLVQPAGRLPAPQPGRYGKSSSQRVSAAFPQGSARTRAGGGCDGGSPGAPLQISAGARPAIGAGN